MPCLLALLALIFPRLVILLLAVFSGYLGRAFSGEWWWPLAGFFLMPYTTLAYAFSVNHGGGVSGLYIVLVVVAVLMDFGALGGGASAGGRWVRVEQRRG